MTQTGPSSSRTRNDERGLRLVLRPGWLLRGRVLDAKGRPVAAAQLSTKPMRPFDDKKLDRVDRERRVAPDARGMTFMTRSSEEGEFQLLLSRREYRLSVEHPERPSWKGVIDEQRETLEIELGDEVRLAGRVIDLEGHPLAGVTVGISCLERRTVHTDDDVYHAVEFLEQDEMPWLVTIGGLDLQRLPA